ncbi:hypothetical protein M758_7G112500 [Ceratodon purpureus]|uniref:Uncharacterized protein n=1 Tax=Ceratodon purpureus TaxID=3225 RepID=A0A8T0H9B5_CERPU|nr:hypothetical protein KC19_7G163900 [Ceratodon purpureus]KAG0611068.1 hypothetical protein M758_7G112500 [Ceratodon purpureus]
MVVCWLLQWKRFICHQSGWATLYPVARGDLSCTLLRYNANLELKLSTLFSFHLHNELQRPWKVIDR